MFNLRAIRAAGWLTRVLAATVIALGLILGAGVLGYFASPVHAACGTATNCGGDNTATSALSVDHILHGTSKPVEPDDGETWIITATWSSNLAAPTACQCTDITDTVTAEVTWTGSGWSASCTGCDATNGPIYQVSVCDGASCSSGGTSHGWEYTLIVDVEHSRAGCQPLGGANFFLHGVEYDPDVVDDGDVIDQSNCAEGKAVTFKGASSDTVTDSGAFECSFDCNATGASITLSYE